MVFFHAKVFPSPHAAAQPAIGGSRFVQKAQSKTLSELLVDDPKLLGDVQAQAANWMSWQQVRISRDA